MNNKALPFVVSLLIHVGIVIALITVAPVANYRLNTAATPPVVHASVVDTVEVKPVPQETPASQPPREAPKAIQKKTKPQDKPQPLPSQAKTTHQAEIEKKRVQQQKIEEQQAAAAAALEKKKQQEALQAKALAEKKQQEEEQKKLQAAVLAEKQSALQQQLLQQQLTNEQQQVIQAQQLQGIIDQYRARILIAIKNQWAIPESAEQGMSCVFTIDLTPEGVVSHVQLVRGSGNTALDRAAEIAIYKASPLPVPKDPSAFNAFRHFTLKMVNQDIL